MKKKLVLFLLIAIAGCTPPAPLRLEEPVSGDSMLVIGAIVVEDDYYTEIPGVHREGIDVAVLGQFVAHGQLIKKGFWTKTDENGYFYLMNLPRGEYALTGIRLYLSDQKLLVITNSLMTQDSEFEVTPGDHIGFTGDFFDISPEGRVVNLQTNFFSVDTQSRGFFDLKYFRRNSIQGLRLIDGLKLEMIPADKYFSTLFAGSTWADILENK
jgi:hypothetical protein